MRISDWSSDVCSSDLNVVFDYRVYSVGAGSEDNWISAGIDGPSTVRKELASVTGATQYEVSVRYRWRDPHSQTRRMLGPAPTATASVATLAEAAATPAAGKSPIRRQNAAPPAAASQRKKRWHTR